MSFHIRQLTQQEEFVHLCFFSLTLATSKFYFQLFKQIETVYLHLPKKIKAIINKQQVLLVQMCFTKNAKYRKESQLNRFQGTSDLLVKFETGIHVRLIVNKIFVELMVRSSEIQVSLAFYFLKLKNYNLFFLVHWKEIFPSIIKKNILILFKKALGHILLQISLLGPLEQN